MSLQARAVDVIDLDEIPSPQPENSFSSATNTSIRLPDLTDILRGFNTKFKAEPHSPSASQEALEFKNKFTHLSHLQENGTVLKPILLNPCKSKVDKSIVLPKIKKPRQQKIKAAKETPLKSARKKPLTVTERAVAPFLPNDPADSSIRALSDGSILDYIASSSTPKTTTATTASVKKTAKRTRRASKKEPVVILDTPRTARRKHAKQNLVFVEHKSVLDSPTHRLNPSKLITLSKGLFHAGSRCADGGLTDGGPEECISNQEALAIQDDEFLNLTMLPARQQNLEDSQSVYNDLIELPSEPQQLNATKCNSDCNSQELQQYLRDLVADSDQDCPEIAFPTTPTRVPKNVRAETIESLRDLLDEDEDEEKPCSPKAEDKSEQQKAEEAQSARKILPCLVTTKGKPKRTRSASSDLKRKVSPKSQPQSSPGPCCISSDSDIIEQTLVVESIEPSEMIISGAVDTSCNSATPWISQPVIDLVAPEDQKSQHIRSPTSKKSSPEYWVVPDSEDNSDNELVQLPTLLPPKPAGPNYNGFTTAQLQTELSRFGFKPVKNRAGMLGLLNKCWKATVSAKVTAESSDIIQARAPAARADPVQLLDPTSTGTESTASSIKPDVARDSKLLTADQKRVQKLAASEAKEAKRILAAQEKAAKKLAAADARVALKVANKQALEDAKIQAALALSDTLTRLIRSDAGRSWWCRIMRYEPIVLEEFVQWLQTAHAITAEPDNIRDYFDTKGVCCVSEITRQGKSRKRM